MINVDGEVSDGIMKERADSSGAFCPTLTVQLISHGTSLVGSARVSIPILYGVRDMEIPLIAPSAYSITEALNNQFLSATSFLHGEQMDRHHDCKDTLTIGTLRIRINALTINSWSFQN
mmetsp:Transcript_18595/g.27593  ORF Transcript_18595/g.27593 Transcript_18595/m.27593 type:complete len:119 (+) Transcript_18595:1644-2000(+)